MSKAFTKEDDEIPERAGRLRSGSGLPPGAVNYLSAAGARLLQEELAKAKGARAAEVRRILGSATVVPAAETTPEEVLFGAAVTVQTTDGKRQRYRIVGVDETRFTPGGVSWVSPLGRALIGTQIGQRVRLPEGDEVVIVEIG